MEFVYTSVHSPSEGVAAYATSRRCTCYANACFEVFLPVLTIHMVMFTCTICLAPFWLCFVANACHVSMVWSIRDSRPKVLQHRYALGDADQILKGKVSETSSSHEEVCGCRGYVPIQIRLCEQLFVMLAEVEAERQSCCRRCTTTTTTTTRTTTTPPPPPCPGPTPPPTPASTTTTTFCCGLTVMIVGE